MTEAASLRRVSLLLAVLGTSAASVSCTDLKLARFRDDRFVAGYRYALGEAYVEVNGIKLCYQERGQGPTVLILPGLGTSVDFWQLNIPALAEQFHVVALDLPGFGKSDKPDAPYDLLWICDGILAFMDAKQLEHASIIGGSLGGHLGLLLALNHPERVDKLVMMGSTGAWPPPHFLLDLGIKLLWNDLIVTDYIRANWPAIHALMFKHETELTRRMLRYHLAKRADGGRFWPEGRASSRALRSIFYNSCRDRLSDVQVPVLLVWGEFDEIHPTEDAIYLRRHLPDARLYIVPDAAHEAMADQPDTFNHVVIAFLESGTAGVADNFIETGRK